MTAARSAEPDLLTFSLLRGRDSSPIKYYFSAEGYFASICLYTDYLPRVSTALAQAAELPRVADVKAYRKLFGQIIERHMWATGELSNPNPPAGSLKLR